MFKNVQERWPKNFLKKKPRNQNSKLANVFSYSHQIKISFWSTDLDIKRKNRFHFLSCIFIFNQKIRECRTILVLEVFIVLKTDIDSIESYLLLGMLTTIVVFLSTQKKHVSADMQELWESMQNLVLTIGMEDTFY